MKMIGVSGLLGAGLCALGMSMAASAIEQGDWMVRARILAVSPNDDSGLVSTGTTGPIAGSGVKVDTGYTLDLDFSYMFTDNIGAELLLDLTSGHDVNSSGALAAIAPGTIIETRALPPSLLLQYHFMPKAKFKPYIGAGLNYTRFIRSKAHGSGKSVLGLSNVELEDSFGFVAQVGADYQLNDRWYMNIDLKYIDMSTTATANSSLGPVRVDVDINPIVVGAGLGYRF